jgi:hypothetical protein
MPDTDAIQHPNVFRAISKKRWYDGSSQRVLPEAFKLRATETGLSVLKSVDCSQQVCLAGLVYCSGEFVLETIRVRDLGLRVIDDRPDAHDYNENHAEIMGLPINPETLKEKQRVEDLAHELAELSSLYYDRFAKYT